MRLAAWLFLLPVFLVTSCDKDSSGPSSAQKRTAGSTEIDHRFRWPADAETYISGEITSRFAGTTTAIRCGRRHGNRGICHARWEAPSGAKCSGKFKLYVNGPYLIDLTDYKRARCTER